MFCVGVFLSFVGHFELMMSSGSLFAQIFVSVTGIAIMTVVAYYISWSKRQDKPLQGAGAKASLMAYSRRRSSLSDFRCGFGATNCPREEKPCHSVLQPTLGPWPFFP